MSDKIENGAGAPAPKDRVFAARGRAVSKTTSYISPFGARTFVPGQSDCFRYNVHSSAT